MAESLVNNLPARYFCHKCNQEINPLLPEFKCPGCREGFIEELTNDVNLDTSSDDSESFENLSGIDDTRTGEILRVLQYFSGDQQRGSRGRGMFETMALPYLQILHGNPGDYAWGSQGLDTIITQLLNTIENNGPPPMPKEEIEKLPTTKVCQDDVKRNLQCTVCMEDYKLDEPVRMLPCNHVYHNDCIVPWLEMHGTCPICRKLLNENQSSQRGCDSHSRSSHSTSNPQQTSSQPVNQRSSSSSSSSNPTNHTSGYRDLLDYD